MALILFVAWGGIIYRLLNALCGGFERDQAGRQSCSTNSSFAIAACCAALFDIRAITVLLAEVFCIECPWKRKTLEVIVDLHPDQGFMRAHGNTTPLSEVTSVISQTSMFNWCVSLMYILAGLPLGLGSLTLQSFDLPFVEICAASLGCTALMREIFGPSLFVKIYLSIEWILALKQKDRDELGRAITRKGISQQCMAGSTLVPVVVLFSLLARRVEDVSVGDNFILFLVCSFFGGLFGGLCGIMHGLPVVPDAKLKVNSFFPTNS